MLTINHNPADSFEVLKKRVDAFFRASCQPTKMKMQLSLDLPDDQNAFLEGAKPDRHISKFIDFLSDIVIDGNIYLFGGILRDIALMGVSGFNSDIDLVVEGSWDVCGKYLESKGARKNKFGGYRLQIGKWPLDVWNAEETWAIKQGSIPYNGITSLTDTTVLNWDAILMNWKTGNVVAKDGYLSALRERRLDIVLEDNPNPLGMAVRVFRHLCMKDAKQITFRAADYLANCATRYSFDALQSKELRSYGNSQIELTVYRWFKLLGESDDADIQMRYKLASDELLREGIVLFPRQTALSFE
jgi:hypothetical protein